MNSIEQVAELSVVDDQHGLFSGDVGILPLETRRTLIQLLAGPTLENRRDSKLWQTLLRDESLIRSRLAELFLDLVIDRELQVAFTRQLDVEELDAPILLRRAQLTFVDSILILYLRQKLAQADAQGVRAVVAIEEIEEHLSIYKQAAHTDHAGFSKRVRASVEKIKTHNILQKIRASEERFEISSTLKLLFSAEEIQALTHLYQTMANETEPCNIQQEEENQ